MTLSDIQQSFFSRNFQLESIREWLIGFGVVITLLLLFTIYKAIQARRIRYNPYGSIVDERMIRNILRSAFDQRRPFEVQMQMDAGQRRPTLRCAPEYIGQNSLTLEINGLRTLSDHWKGRPVTIFFRIMAGREYTYYTFASTISGIHHPKSGICHLTVHTPTALENRQKRSFLRIAPPREFFMGGAIWCKDAMPTPENIAEISRWPRPRLLLIPERMEQFRLVDLSAGGARITIPNRVVRSLSLELGTTEQIVLMLDLFDPEQSRRLRFWMQCRIQNIWLEHQSRDMHMGVQFIAWARPKGGDETLQSDGIEWLRMSSSSEVEPVGNWIMRRHLELFREQPADGL